MQGNEMSILYIAAVACYPLPWVDVRYISKEQSNLLQDSRWYFAESTCRLCVACFNYHISNEGAYTAGKYVYSCAICAQIYACGQCSYIVEQNSNNRQLGLVSSVTAVLRLLCTSLHIRLSMVYCQYCWSSAALTHTVYVQPCCFRFTGTLQWVFRRVMWKFQLKQNREEKRREVGEGEGEVEEQEWLEKCWLSIMNVPLVIHIE